MLKFDVTFLQTYVITQNLHCGASDWTDVGSHPLIGMLCVWLQHSIFPALSSLLPPSVHLVYSFFLHLCLGRHCACACVRVCKCECVCWPQGSALIVWLLERVVICIWFLTTLDCGWRCIHTGLVRSDWISSDMTLLASFHPVCSH